METKQTRQNKTEAKKLNKKTGTEKLFIAILAIIIICIGLIFYILLIGEKAQEKAQETKGKIEEKEEGISREDKSKEESVKEYKEHVVESANVTYGYASMIVPAVDKDGNGVVTEISVEVLPGNGKVLVDINNLLFWADTQESIRKASEVAKNITGIDLSNYDLIYRVYANASVVGGPSAGAALAIITIAALENKSIKKDVSITATLNYDGTFGGPVHEVLQKAIAAKKNGIKTLLVPLGQSKEVKYEQKRTCRVFGYAEYCSIEVTPKIVNINEIAKIDVREVINIQEAKEYFFD